MNRRGSARRYVVVGTSGSGKTWLAKATADRLGIPYICNDAIIWGPDWTPTPREARYPLFEKATRAPAWTYDGNIGSLKDREDAMILDRADTLVWLDLPRGRIMSYLLCRTLYRTCFRVKLWHGNREGFRNVLHPDDSILWWSWRTYDLRKRQYAAIFADKRWGHLRRVRLTSRNQINHWLSQLQPLSDHEVPPL